MAGPLVASGSTSSDFFEPDDPEFIQALQTAVLPGDLPVVSESHDAENKQPETSFHSPNPLKRSRSVSPDNLSPDELIAQAENDEDLDRETYGASRFGQFGEYMRRKRAKLQIQNAHIDDEGPVNSSTLFRGLAIYINGWTNPSVQDLRRLIIKHGGTFHAYLDKKALVTHIITCSLTPAKIREFKHMKVARPEWLVESAKAGVLLPWKDFMFRPGDRVERSQGANTAQRSLADGFVSQVRSQRSTAEGTNTTERESSQQFDESSQELEAPPSTQPRRPIQIQTPPQSPSKPPTIPTIPSPAVYTTDPATLAQAALVPSYAAHASNPIASRALANPEWRSAHTSVAPDFIEGYYKNSRLHHLSTWKAELRGLVTEAQERAENGVGICGNLKKAGEEDDGDVVQRIVLENVGGYGRGEGRDGVSMKGAELVMKSPSKSKGKEKEKASDEEGESKVIMHCDFDCFFVSAGLVSRPRLRGKPIVVCHSQGAQGGGASTSEIASASYEARKFGIKNGMSLQQARKLCPTVMTIPYEFERYKQFSLQFYTILMSHADDLQAVSVDEALMDVTSSVARIKSAATQSQNPSASPADPAKEFAEAIRAQVKKTTGCEVSIGIAHNILLARLATRRAKPARSYHLLPADIPDFLAPLDIADLHGFGGSARQKAQEKLGATALGELAGKSRGVLCDALGKATGETLYKAIRGIDDKKLESDKPRKSVSSEINYGIRFETNDQAQKFIFQMAEEVARRMDSIDVRGRSLTLKIMKRDPTAPVNPPKFLGHGLCDIFNKQIPLAGPGGRATSDDKIIGESAWKLLKAFNFDPKELRGIGIHIQKLESTSAVANPEPGQAKLPFKPRESPSKAVASSSGIDVDNETEPYPRIVIQPPSQEEDDISDEPVAGPSKVTSNFELPSFSQVDKSVLEALPDDVRKQLEAEYERRSHSPVPVDNLPVPSRGLSLEPPVPAWPRKFSVKGTTNVKRITQQLAPRNRASISPNKSTLFTKRTFGASNVRISEAELRELDIDPEVFAMLPKNLQREQVSMARAERAPGGPNVIVGPSRKVIKPYYRPLRSPSSYTRLPPPQANHPQPPFLKQQGKEKGEKLYFTETEDVQTVIEAWVERFQEHPPNEKDVNFFSKWLVQCVDAKKSTDRGVEKAVAVMKWWLVLLRRYWGMWEADQHEPGSEGKERRITSEVIGKAWWRAFRQVKANMDVTARKKFGGSLSLK